MTLSGTQNGSLIRKTSIIKDAKQSPFRVICHGEYCKLIHSLDPQRDIVQNEQNNGKYQSGEVESRDRAFSVIKCLFTKDELGSLEASGKLIHLRIPQKINQYTQRAVPKESILISKKEHRLAFLELTQAEASSSITTDIVCGSCGEEKKKEFEQLNDDLGLFDDKSRDDVLVCEMCYHVYRLLSHARCLLSNNFTSTPLGKAESEVFGLNTIVRQSCRQINRQSSKRNILGRLPSQAQHVESLNDVEPKPKLLSGITAHDSSSLKTSNKLTVCSSPLSPLDKTKKKRKTKRVDVPSLMKQGSKNSPINRLKIVPSVKRNPCDVVKRSASTCTFDEKTSFPFIVLGDELTSIEPPCKTSRKSQEEVYNLVICHDIFDTYERMEIFFSVILEKYPYHRILVWNYPGQAYTTFDATQSLNNEFHAKCLDHLLRRIGPEGTNEFDLSKPFFMLGHGHGGSIACKFVSDRSYIPGLRGICLINPLTFVDTHFASVLHDCRNVFSCSPVTRPDLPLYFYSRFVFSQEYLQKVSAPLALNLYTAVHNPITIQGRVRLCNGVLNNIDIRERLKEIRAPIISIHGKHSELVRPLHAESFIEGRDQCSTIHGALDQEGKRKSLLVMIEGGYELFQEKKKAMLGFVEDLLMGRKKMNVTKQSPSSIKVVMPASNKWSSIIKDSVVFKDTASASTTLSHQKRSSPKEKSKLIDTSDKADTTKTDCDATNSPRITKEDINIMLDPENPSFERQQNFIYKPGNSMIYPSSNKYVKPTEYMSWRLRRNRKRLSRFQKAARVIQGALRVYMAKTMISRLRRQRSAMDIQRCFRGMLGRQIFKNRLKDLWAARLVQRSYRGALGRRTSYHRRISIKAEIDIARVWRGYVDRRLVNKMVSERNTAAINLQSLWRRCMAIERSHTLRKRNCCSITIQRLFRGHVGRKRADIERDKYLFSKSQSLGIELGRQMLVEHKVHATRLQSELSILNEERKSLESKVDSITNELYNFQKQARGLEKAMHEISIVEAQKRSDVAAQHVIRQKKVQLNDDFSRLFAKISDRKNQLKILEEKLNVLDKNKTTKSESLRNLERKLVALLEAQEHELSQIKRKQDEKIEAIKNTGVFPPRVESDCGISSNPETLALVNHEKKQTAKLMDSTETMMKFGFMSMAMTYFTSMNMVGAMKNISTKEMKELEYAAETFNQNNMFQHGKENENSQHDVNIQKWDVDDVVQWLSTIHLKQYEEQFRDASIDGPFLCQLNDDDLKEALGIEHVLHRKKLLLSINSLKSTTKDRERRNAVISQPRIPNTPQKNINDSISNTTFDTDDMSAQLSQALEEMKQSYPALDQLHRWIRNRKDSKIKDKLRDIPDQDFDQTDIRVQFVEGLGTAYVKSIDDQPFHINKCDEHGNTLMHVAAQNGNMKIAMFLIRKGANSNHQNKQGQTPGHFAVAYQFYDFASWLFDPDGGKGNDLLTNIYGLGPYDGLTDE